MTNEEAIRRIQDHIRVHEIGEYPHILLKDALDMALSALRAKQPNASMTGWISVKERLPKTDGIYIVCDRRFNGNPWIHTAGFKKVSSSWCESHGVYYDDGYGRYGEQDKFTHWMPLPEPPEKAEKGGAEE